MGLEFLTFLHDFASLVNPHLLMWVKSGELGSPVLVSMHKDSIVP